MISNCRSYGNVPLPLDTSAKVQPLTTSGQGDMSAAGDSYDAEVEELKASDNKLRNTLLRELSTLIEDSVVYENKGRDRALTKMDSSP